MSDTGSSTGRWGAAALASLLLLLPACTGDTADSPDAGSTATSPAGSPSPDGAGASTESASPSPTAPTSLPGEDVDTGVAAGSELTVMGVSYDDQLPVLLVPGGDEAVSALAPRADVVATGRSRSLGSGGGVWHEVEVGSAPGWVPGRSLAWVGQTTDETSGLLRSIGRRPVADTLLGLGRVVTRSSAYNDPSSGSRVVVSAEPTEGDLGEVTYDVTGVPDDSVTGVRIHLFARPTEAGRWSLTSVELTYLCGRGLDDRGRCV